VSPAKKPKAKIKGGGPARQLHSPAPPELIEKLQAIDLRWRAYWDAMPKVTAQDRAALRGPPVRVEVISSSANRSEPKPGSADAWIDMLHSTDWHLCKPKKVWQEASARDPNAPSYSSFLRAFRARRGRK
jgi:hypothetical protein